MLSQTVKKDLQSPFILGNDWIFPFQFVTYQNEIVDITNYTFELFLFQDNVVLDFCPLSAIIDDATTGNLHFVVPRAETTNLSVGNYEYSVLVTNPDNLKVTYLKGNFQAVTL